MKNNIIEEIKQQIQDHPILLYMKGTLHMPKCGFSAKAAKIISNCTTCCTYIDVLFYTDIRATLPKFSNWPTFPQLWIEKKLVGGCDIIIDMYNNGTLKSLIQKVELKYKMI